MAAKSKKGKHRDKRPARARYWSSGRLAFRKIKNLMRCGRMKLDKAMKTWEGARKRHYGVGITVRQLKKLKKYDHAG